MIMIMNSNLYEVEMMMYLIDISHYHYRRIIKEVTTVMSICREETSRRRIWGRIWRKW